MILIKGFFRNFKSKIYILVFSIIFIIMQILMNFNTFFKETLNNLYIENSSVLLITNKEYSSELSKYKNIKNIMNVILFTKGSDTDIISQQDYVIQKDGNVIDSYQSDGENKTELFWDDIIPVGFTNIFAVCDKELELSDNEIKINITDGIEFKKESVESLVGKNINLKFNDEEMTFEIRGISNSISPGITISETLYNELKNNSIQYGYIINEKVFKESIKIENDLKEKYQNEVIRVSNYNSYSENTYRKIESYEKILSSINIFVTIISIIFLIIFLVCILNLISDEILNLKCEKILGYNKSNIYFQLFLEEILLISISISISTIISFVITYIVRSYLKISLMYIYLNNIILLYVIIVLCTFIISFIKMKKELQ